MMSLSLLNLKNAALFVLRAIFSFHGTQMPGWETVCMGLTSALF